MKRRSSQSRMSEVLRRLLPALVLVLLGCGEGVVQNPYGDQRSAAGSAGLAAGGAAAMGATGGMAGAGNVSLSCSAGQLNCSGTCVDPASDANHCGACGTRCAAGSVCRDRACQVMCASGQTACAGTCKTIVSDPMNCGGCGVACPTGQFCSSGTCTANCAFQPCDGPLGTECADTQTNPGHCGLCGAACAAGQSCVQGVCALACSAGQLACGGACVDTRSNVAHCGACGAACASGTPCVEGRCGCPQGQTLCNGACVDVTNSPQHCGACGTACPSGQACEAGQCRTGCSAQLTACSGSCVDTATAEAHCGGCGTACPATQTCEGGTCRCPSGSSLCNGSCVDTQADEANCGGCGMACAGAEMCSAGRCACPGTTELCGAACIDTQTSNDHCGGCGEACAGGSMCSGGACVCPMGRSLCEDSCVDTQTSDAHCGECGVACAMGQACVAGVCTGDGGVGLDGCSGGPARNITLSRIDAFQTVRVRLVDDGEEVAASARNTDVVAERPTLFRVFVTPGSGWAARELSARVTLVNGAASDQFFAKKTVSGASSENETASTFQISVPAEKIQADTRYFAELVECGTPAGDSATAPRFPATGDTALGARATGPLKIRVIPIRSNSRVPDTSEAGLQPYRELLEAMYPVTGVELSAGTEISGSYPVDWNGALEQVRAKRQQDAPAADVYYYGLIKPTETFQEFCRNGCTAGVGFVPSLNDASRRVSMGIGFPGGQSTGTMAHEIGHNHGRSHAPCVPQGSSISGVDGNYPYSGGAIGVWGYDNRSQELIEPNGITDIMGYCNDKWISDYTYDALVNRVVSINGAKIRENPDILGRFRVLLVDALGPRWGLPITELSAPAGTAEVAEILDAAGDPVEHVIVYRTEVSDIDAASIMVPEPEPHWHAVRVSGSRAHAFSAPVVVPPP